MTPTDPVVGIKRKQTEKSMRRHKKRKDEISARTVSLTNNDYTLLTETMIEMLIKAQEDR